MTGFGISGSGLAWITSYLSDMSQRIAVLKLAKDEPEQNRSSFAPKHRTKELTEFIISFGGNIIHDTPYIKNLGAYFDRTRSIEMKYISFRYRAK